MNFVARRAARRRPRLAGIRFVLRPLRCLSSRRRSCPPSSHSLPSHVCPSFRHPVHQHACCAGDSPRVVARRPQGAQHEPRPAARRSPRPHGRLPRRYAPSLCAQVWPGLVDDRRQRSVSSCREDTGRLAGVWARTIEGGSGAGGSGGELARGRRKGDEAGWLALPEKSLPLSL